ncbi:MAG: GGDEF domain-containing protein [Firmicutes bacterium]|nr:GGDEF domain-containing protein [Bacillota bacterium]
MPLACSGEMITLVDEHHGVIASTNPLIQPGTGFWETKSRDFHHQIEDSVEHFILFRRGPFLERWRHSRYILDKEITFENLSLHAPWRIIIEHSITPHVEALYDYYNSSLMGLLLLLFAAAVAALLGSYWLGKPIRILAALTQGLPEKLHQDQEILWPKARIVEQDVLLKNYQEMATAINLHIEAIDAYAARLEHSVQRDALTGLFNRTVLPERLRTAIERARNANSSFALLFIDLDRFKTVNDLHGHAAGDAVLVEVAERLTAHSSEACCVIRLGGDEFTVLLEKAAHQTVVDFIRRFFDSMERPITIAGADIVIDTSVGISIYPQDGNDAGVLLKRADSAMYRAKQETGNTYCFYESPTDD